MKKKVYLSEINTREEQVRINNAADTIRKASNLFQRTWTSLQNRLTKRIEVNSDHIEHLMK